ncbi:MAG: hypothetical protein J1E63_01445 [Muribaculaceae bacterium]|nr:hypothetical protein [Muribaculaceae bacterium]
MTPTPEPQAETPRKRRPWWRRALKITGITLLSIVALVLILLSAVVAILKPERLTPLVERIASEHIDADVSISRVELTFWSTFPRFRVDVDTLKVVSNALKSLPAEQRAMLPEAADSLLRVDHFDGTINLARLLTGEIAIYDVNIVRPAATIVVADSLHANYNIFPTSEDTDTASSGPLPDISLGTFTIVGDAPIRYISMPDSTDVALTLATSSVAGAEEKTYDLSVKGITSARMADFDLSGLRLGLGGRVIFDPADLTHIEARDLTIGLNDLITKISTTVNASTETSIERLSVDIPTVALNSILELLPEDMTRQLPPIETDMTLAATMELQRPYVIGDTTVLPSFDATLRLDAGHFFMRPLHLHKLHLDAAASIDGRTLDNSVVTINRLQALGHAVEVDIDGSVRYPMSDPLVDAGFKGRLDVSRLPALLLEQLPASIAGVLEADARVHTRLSYLTPENFHRMRATGKATLTGARFAMRDSSLSAYVERAEFDLGTSNSFVRGEHTVDSLLTASLKIDTLHVGMPGMEVGASGMMAGIGMANRSSSADTTRINPIAGRFSVGLLNVVSEADTMRLRLRDMTARAMLTRYKGGSRAPLLAATINAGRLRWTDRFNRASLSDGEIKLQLHPSEIALRRSAMTAGERDSLRTARASATAARDAERQRREAIDSLDRREMIDMRVDRTMRQMLRDWQATGSIKAASARVMTPYYPMRCRLENLDVNFTTDSIAVTNTRLRLGKSDFTVNGYISNLTRALTSRRPSPLRVNFNLESDNIDINALAQAAFAGSAFAENAATATPSALNDLESDDAMEAAIAAGADQTAALLVPSNVDADLKIHAKNVSYADVAFRNFNGDLRVHDGALNLNNLSATADVGRVDLSALYSAPTRRDLQFTFGMRLRDFKIANFLEMMPAVDSLMPLLRDISGIVNAEMVATTNLDPDMNINLPSLSAALKLSGDSLVLMDAETFRTIGKWLMFKDKGHNMIDHMTVQIAIQDSRLQLYPFMFDMDRYRLGVMGSNDLALNYNYHVSILKSPVPFKFGINLTGNAGDGKMKVRLGGAKFKENMVGQELAITDTTRINLLRTIENAFRAGVERGRIGRLNFRGPAGTDLDTNIDADTISATDSLLLVRQGILPSTR